MLSYFPQPYRRNKYQEYQSLFTKLNVEYAVHYLGKSGIYLGLELPQSITEDICKFASFANIYVNQDPQIICNFAEKEEWQLKHGKEILLGDCLNASQLCPVIEKIEKDPKLLEIAANYLNGETICTDVRLWWSFTGKSNLQERLAFAQELFHYDAAEFGAIKFFFYITDVDLYSGPHICVRGSHTKKKLSQLFTLFIGRSDQEIIDYYSWKNIVTICGKAGFGFAEDPFCFHKGTPPIQKNRLMLQLVFRRISRR